jgi:HAD superfamily hydrolase (TIGR01549 family)
MTDTIQTTYDGIVFDMDGVIVEPTDRAHITDAVQQAFRECGHDIKREYAEWSIATDAEPAVLVGDFALDPVLLWETREDAVALAQIQATQAGGKQLYTDTEVLSRLDAPLSLVSNNQAETVEFMTQHHDLDEFKTSYGREHSVAGAARRKPRPYYLKQALLDLDCNPQSALYVGDSEKDIVAAQRAGMESAFLRRDHVDNISLSVEPTIEVRDLYGLAEAITART